MRAADGRGTGEENVASVVVSHNSSADLRECIEALDRAEHSGVVLVIDNASGDDSVAVAESALGGRARVQALERNTGFAGGCNRGFAMVAEETEFLAFMNPDVRVAPDCFTRCLRVFEAHPEAGCVAPLLLRPDGTTVDSAGQGLRPGSLEVLDREYGRTLVEGSLEPGPVLAACGALAVFRRKALEGVLEESGPWPESFFCFWEDLELGWRLNNAGWVVRFEPTARAAHGRGAGATDGRGPLRWRRTPFLEACILSNRWMTLIRHLPALDLLPRAPVLLGWDLALVLLGVVRRPAVAFHLARRLPLVLGEVRRRGARTRKRLDTLPW